MAIKRNKRFHAEVHASSMSDIMFFLLLFFLIISTLANPNVIKMTLPKSKEKEYFIDKQPVAFEELEKELLAKVGNDKEQTVVVRIPFNLQVQDLVDVLQIGVKNNMKFVIATNPK